MEAARKGSTDNGKSKQHITSMNSARNKETFTLHPEDSSRKSVLKMSF